MVALGCVLDNPIASEGTPDYDCRAREWRRQCFARTYEDPCVLVPGVLLEYAKAAASTLSAQLNERKRDLNSSGRVRGSMTAADTHPCTHPATSPRAAPPTCGCYS